MERAAKPGVHIRGSVIAQATHEPVPGIAVVVFDEAARDKPIGSATTGKDGSFEIKAKQSEVLTHKHRIAIPFRSETIGDAELAFLRAHLGAAIAERLRPELRVEYKRIGLLALGSTERVTIDLDMRFIGMDGKIHEVGDAIVLEVKQSATSRSTN